MRSSAREAASVSPTSTGCRCSRSSRSTRRRASEATRGRRSPFAAPTRRRRRRSARALEPCRRACTSSARSSPCPPSANVVGGPRAPLVLPIFPLPDVTFFPHTLLPLHVFEARYRAMVIDALERDRRLAVVKLRPGYEATYAGKPEVHPVAGLGEIVSCERLSTGRYNILLRGESRVRLEQELPSDTLYRLVRARRLADAEPGGDVAPALARIRASCKTLLEALTRPADLLDT